MMFRELGDKWWIAWSLDGLAKVAAAQKQHTRAVRLFGSAKALRDSAGVSGPAHQRALCERYLAAARDELDEAALRGDEKSGTQLLLKAAVVWGTNVITFGLWFWEFDRGGPARRLKLGSCPIPGQSRQ